MLADVVLREAEGRLYVSLEVAYRRRLLCSQFSWLKKASSSH